MQEFYVQLCEAQETEDAEWTPLAQLTQATVAQLSVLEKVPDWIKW